jgi:hypothetical protein
MQKPLFIVSSLLLLAGLAGSPAHADGWNFPVDRPTGCGCAGGYLTVYAVCVDGIVGIPILDEWYDYPVSVNGSTPKEHAGRTVTDVAFKWNCGGNSTTCQCKTSWTTLSGDTQWLPGNTWVTPPFREWVDQNMDEVRMPVLHAPGTCGEGTGGELHVHVNLGTWDDRPALPSYSVVNGTCPDLPGFLIGNTPIVFDPDAPEGVYPFSTADPYTGTLLVHGEVVLQGTPTGAGPSAPTTFALYEAEPNPFNPTTTIRFDVGAPAHVTLGVYDVSGRLVRTLIDRDMPPSRQAVVWDGVNSRGELVSSGVYLYRLTAGSFSAVRKMVMLK